MTHVYGTCGTKEFEVPCSNIEYISDKYTEEQMISLYQRCDCLIVTSRGESFCLPIIEAISCGLQVICPDAKPFTEIINTELFVKTSTKIINPYKTFIGKWGDAFSNMGSHFTIEEVQLDALLSAMHKAQSTVLPTSNIPSWNEVMKVYENTLLLYT